MKPRVFTAKDVGCHIDGAYGEEHRRHVLSLYMKQLGYSVLAHELLQSVTDDYDDTEDDVIEILQEHTQDGLIWIQEAGDLLLVEEREAF